MFASDDASCRVEESIPSVSFEKESSRLLNISAFRAGIRAIFNLESPDEHVLCGHGNHQSGFSYDPSEFMDVGSESPMTFSLFVILVLVFVYNYAMEDYGTVKVETILDIMQVMNFAMKQGKVCEDSLVKHFIR